jgi:hypothetical protein
MGQQTVAPTRGHLNRPRRLTNARAAVITAIIALLGVLIPVVTGLLHKPEPPPPVCAGDAATVTGPTAYGNAPDFSVQMQCPPETGTFYLWISEVLNVDPQRNGGHSEFYVVDDITAVPVGAAHRKSLNLSQSPIGTRRLFYIIKLNAEGRAALGQNPLKSGGHLSLPNGYSIVSNKAPYTQAW